MNFLSILLKNNIDLSISPIGINNTHRYKIVIFLIKFFIFLNREPILKNPKKKILSVQYRCKCSE